MILTSLWSNPGIILLLLLICFGAIALIVFLIRKFMNKNKEEEKPTEDTVIKEDLDRYLQPVDDEETQKAFEEYEENASKEDEDK